MLPAHRVSHSPACSCVRKCLPELRGYTVPMHLHAMAYNWTIGHSECHDSCHLCVVLSAGKFLDVLQSTLECHRDEDMMQLAAAVVGHFLQSHTRDVLPGFFITRLCGCIGRLLANTKSNKLTASLLGECAAQAELKCNAHTSSFTSFGITAYYALSHLLPPPTLSLRFLSFSWWLPCAIYRLSEDSP